MQTEPVESGCAKWVPFMIGITLSSEQIRRAPTEVRRWIEHEIATSLGMPAPATQREPQPQQLVACTRDELASVLSLIQGVFPVLNVFFELGRKGMSLGQPGLEAYRLSDIQHHTRLQSPEQAVACLNIINETLHRVRGSADASFCGIDGEYCLIAEETQQNIRRLWLDLISRGDAASSTAEPEAAAGNVPGQEPPGVPLGGGGASQPV